MANTFSRAAWHSYYSRKRIVHQWLQVHLLAGLECERILEIGPGLGLVTSLLVNLGYEVETLDVLPRAFDYPDVRHLQKDVRELQSAEIAGYDAILCCESLEHIDWPQVSPVLATLRASGAKFLIVSVPYMGFQIAFDLYLNRTTARHYFSMKKLLWRREFEREAAGGHQWEIGYRRYPLRIWEDQLENAGWSIVTREFTEHCRSVFHVLRAN
jgi:hypothetical protein